MNRVSTTTLSRALAAAALAGLLACGGRSTPTEPSNPVPIPAADACSILSALGSGGGQRIDILSGSACDPPDRSPVVKLNLKGAGGGAVGSCTGTIVLPRVVLTAAHCLDQDVTSVRVWLGSGPEYVAQSFTYYPGFVFNQTGFDVGLVFLGEDLPRSAASLLTSRRANVGETAIIAGYGRDENNVTVSLRAGSTAVSGVTDQYIQTQFAPPSSSVCSGDSGGPLFLQHAGRWSIAGITSATSTDACNQGTNFYQATNNTGVIGWIKQQAPGITER